MLKKSVSILVSILMVLAVLPIGEMSLVSAEVPGMGSWSRPYTVTDTNQLVDLLGSSSEATVYIRLNADLVTENDYAISSVYVRGKKCLDLCGYTLKSKRHFHGSYPTDSLFIIQSGASMTLEDSVGGGEIIFDRYIPNMGETNYEADIFLDRPLSVFDVSGTLTVNGGEITAGHYESEYYTYTDGFTYTDSRPTPGTVNSVTPGNAVVVKNGGRFVSGGGEYYGRGFIMDEDGGKEASCAALSLYAGATAVINAGDFYGKSNADVFSIDGGASVTVYSGNFYARYDSRITVNKQNGVAYYLNADCGRIGLPLRAFNNGQQAYTHIYINSAEYNYSPNYTSQENTLFMNLGSDGTGIDVTVETMEGNGTKTSPYLLKNASDIGALMDQDKMTKVYISLANDISDCYGNYSVNGNIVLDLNGHTLSGQLGFNDSHSSFALFLIGSGSYMTVEDSVGGGEILFDRRIPSMGETNEQTDIFLYRALTVFRVDGTLTVNSGEITAGHYESEYYTYTKKYLTSGSTNAGTVHSITPGTAVMVRDGGRFVSNGGEYYGRGFTIDDNGEKDFVCAAVYLKNGAAAIINDGKFYGKSNADVFSVAWGASASVYSGLFNAQYDNRITVDKNNGTATYVNVDCGRVGLPLYAFTHSRGDRCVIEVDSEEYTIPSNFTSSQSAAFENLGADSTGITVTVEPEVYGNSLIAREDGIASSVGLTYSPTDHFELIHNNAAYYSDTFGAIPEDIRSIRYSWEVTKRSGSSWVDVTYASGAPVSNGYYQTDGNRLDLYDLARNLNGGMEHGASYRVVARAVESWMSDGTEILYTQSTDNIEIDCVYESIGTISLPDSVTGIVWPGHGQKPKHITVDQEAFTATLTFQELASDGVHWAEMSERSSVFTYGKSYRLWVQITPKAFYRAEDDDSVTVGGKTVPDLTESGLGVSGHLSLSVLPAVVSSVTVQGSLSEGCKLSARSPLTSATTGVTVSATWFKNGTDVTNQTATGGNYRARLQVTAQTAYTLTAQTMVKVFGKNYTVTNLSSDNTVGYVLTDEQYVACSHSGNTNSYSYDSSNHSLICSVCGEQISSAAHTMGDWVANGGVDIRTCTVCGYSESVSNGKQAVPFIRLTGEIPVAGDTLPSLEVCEADRKYAALENNAEWCVDEVKGENFISADTVMQAGRTYYAFVKCNVKSGYYFDDDTAVVTLNTAAASSVRKNGSQSHLETILCFTPRTVSSAQFTLPDMEIGQTYGDFLSGIRAQADGAATSFLVAIYRDNSYEASLAYNCDTASWWIASGDVNEFLARKLAAGADYRFAITVSDSGKHFDPDLITVLNSEAAQTVQTACSDLGCTLTATYTPGSNVIENVALTGIQYPILGEVLSDVIPEQTGHYRISDLYWIDDGLNMPAPGDAFVPGKVYMVIARITATGKFVFADPRDLTATVDGTAAQVISATENTLNLRYVFPAAAAPGDLDGNGEWNAGDLAQLQAILLSGGSDPRADLNKDGEVNILDMIRLKKLIVEKE